MPDLTIDDIWTFENVNTPTQRTSSFVRTRNYSLPGGIYESAFGIALQVSCAYAMLGDLRIQFVNFRGDPSHGKMWFGRNGVQSTIDLDGDVPSLKFLTNAFLPAGQNIFWIWWSHYSDVFGSIGSGLLSSICELRAQVQTGFLNVFATTKPHAWTWSFLNET